MFQSQSQSQSSEERQQLFAHHLASYNFPAFGKEDHQQFVLGHLLNTPSVTETYVVLPPSHLPENDQNVLDSMYKTVPVYWGKSKDDLINWEAVQQNFGYTKADTQMSNEATSNTRYAIIGPVKVMPHGGEVEGDAIVCHIWAANFESTTTADYQTMIAPHISEDKMDLEAIKTACYFRHYEMLKLVIDSSLITTPENDLHIQSALNGAGCFLKGLPQVLRDMVLQVQVDATRAVIANYKRLDGTSPFTFKMAIYTPDEFPASIVTGYQKINEDYSNFSVGVGRDQGNVLGHLDMSKKNVIVNAGDPKSGKGNGMSKDFTVEGFVVANAGGFNPQFRNTSFLHNPRFNPDLSNPVNWARTQ